jgi:hypothetical protein
MRIHCDSTSKYIAQVLRLAKLIHVLPLTERRRLPFPPLVQNRTMCTLTAQQLAGLDECSYLASRNLQNTFS